MLSADLEFRILDFIQNHVRSDFLDVLMPVISSLGNAGAIWIILGVVLIARKKTRKMGWSVMFALLLDLVVCNLILKPFVARIRPYDVNTAVSLLIAKPLDFSFPSGHTAASFTSFSALLFATRDMKNKKYRIWLCAMTAVLALLIAFSRLYLYVHYPTDVLAGALLGMMFGWGGCKIADAVYRLRKV